MLKRMFPIVDGDSDLQVAEIKNQYNDENLMNNKMVVIIDGKKFFQIQILIELIM